MSRAQSVLFWAQVHKAKTGPPPYPDRPPALSASGSQRTTLAHLEPLHRRPSPNFPSTWPAFFRMGVAKGQGAIALYILKGKLGVGSRFTTPGPVLTRPLSTPVSPLPPETLTPSPCPGPRFLGSLSSLQILGCSTQEQRVWCVCEAGGTRMGIGHGEQRGRRHCLLLLLRHEPTAKPALALVHGLGSAVG